MTPPTPKTRRESCTPAQARKRLQDAHKFLEVAEMVDDQPTQISTGVSGALAVLAGIAASDAACCLALGERPRGDNHKEAVGVLRTVEGARDAANALQRLLAMKDEAEYGLWYLSGTKRTTALRQARKLVAFADDVATRA